MVRTPFVLLAITATALQAQGSQRYNLTGARIGIYNLAGKAVIQPGTGSAVVVDVAKAGADAGKLTVETGTVREQMTLRVRYPSDVIIYPEGRNSSSTESVREDGTFNGDFMSDDEHRRGRTHSYDQRNRVTIRSRGTGLEAHADLTVSVPAGATVAVYVAVGQITASNVNGHIHFDGSSGSVDASSMKGSLSVDVGSGNVTVRGMTGDLNIDTGSGDVDVSGMKGTGLNIDTGSGNVSVADAQTTQLTIDTGSGDVDATGVSAQDMNIDTGSGRVNLALTADAETIKIDTGSGDVTLTVPDSFGAQVDIEPGSGGVESEIAIATRRWSNDHVTGTIGDGKGHLRVETGSGGVRIKKAGGATTSVRR